MASADSIDITLRGRGTHAAFPHLGTDVIVASAQLITALQTVTSRWVDPLEQVVLSVTQIHAGETYNIIPEEIVLRGTVRSFKPAMQDIAEAAIGRITHGVAAAFGVTADYVYTRGYPATVNTTAESAFAAKVAAEVVGADNVRTDPEPKMGAEDFSYMLLKRPGCYVWLGNAERDGQPYLHNPGYDFNDRALSVGASYWARLVEMRLAKR